MISYTEICVVLTSILAIIIFKLINVNPTAIFNVYQRPNGLYWLKVAFMYFILSLRKLANRIKKHKINQNDFFANLDKPQELSKHSNAIDAVYFNGASKSGDYLVVGTARRKNNLLDGFFYLLLEESGLGLLESPKVPDTALCQTEEEVNSYSAEGISIKPVEPMKKWKICYKGQMKQNGNKNKIVNVEIDAEWQSDLPYFNFDVDMDALAMAKSMAYEKFSRDYFKTLEANHQTHYEQHGDIKGTVKIEDKLYPIEINAVRDHSFGLQREWRNFHRYGLHFFSTENGDRFNVGMICMPISFSNLTIGYVYSAEEKKMHAVKWCDLQLYQHGEDGVPPTDYAFSFIAGKKKYTVQVNVLHSPHFYISKDWESKVVERLCTFNVNGVKGWGAAEWQYRNINGKNVVDIK